MYLLQGYLLAQLALSTVVIALVDLRIMMDK